MSFYLCHLHKYVINDLSFIENHFKGIFKYTKELICHFSYVFFYFPPLFERKKEMLLSFTFILGINSTAVPISNYTYYYTI